VTTSTWLAQRGMLCLQIISEIGELLLDVVHFLGIEDPVYQITDAFGDG
jgi:hypothetical protein